VEGSTPRPGRFTSGKVLRCPLYRRLVGLRGRSARRWEEEKICCPQRGLYLEPSSPWWVVIHPMISQPAIQLEAKRNKKGKKKLNNYEFIID